MVTKGRRWRTQKLLTYIKSESELKLEEMIERPVNTSGKNSPFLQGAATPHEVTFSITTLGKTTFSMRTQNTVMLSVVMPNVIMPTAIMLSVVMPFAIYCVLNKEKNL